MCRGGAHVEDYARGILRHFKPSFYKAGFGMVPWYQGVFSKKNYFNQTLQDIFLGNRCSIRLLQNIFYLSSLGLQRPPARYCTWLKPCRSMDDSVHHIHLTQSGRISLKKTDNISKFNCNIFKYT